MLNPVSALWGIAALTVMVNMAILGNWVCTCNVSVLVNVLLCLAILVIGSITSGLCAVLAQAHGAHDNADKLEY